MRRNIKNKKTKKKVLHGGSNYHRSGLKKGSNYHRLGTAARVAAWNSARQPIRDKWAVEGEERKAKRVRECSKLIHVHSNEDPWTAWYDKYIKHQCDWTYDARTSFYNSRPGKGNLNYNKYNSPLFENKDGTEYVIDGVGNKELHEWHKLIANNNEIRDFAILKLLFQLTTNQKEIMLNQDKNNKNWTDSFTEVMTLLNSMNREPTNPTKDTDTDPNK